MTPAALPEYDFLPAPLWLVTVLHLLTLTLHLVAMNCLLGGLVVVLLGRIPDRWENPAVRRFLSLFPTLMAATVTLGVAPLLFVQLVYGPSVYASAIVSGWWWFLIPFVVIVGYYMLYGSAFARAGNPRVRTWVSVAVLCLLYVSVTYSAVFSLVERPDLQRTLYEGTQSGLAFNPHVSEWAFRWLHMIAGAVTVGAFLVSALGRGDAAVAAAGRRAFVWGMIASMAVGLVYLLTLGDALRPFMRSSGIWFLAAGILLAFGALHLHVKQRLLAAGAALLLSLATMVVSRHALRLVQLEGTFDPASWRVEPQWGVFALFLVCFVAALLVVAWMLRTFARGRPDAPAA
jgi:hypothetical protein